MHWVSSYRLSNVAYDKSLRLGHFPSFFPFRQRSTCATTSRSELQILDVHTNKTKKSLSKLIRNFRRYEFFKFQNRVKQIEAKNINLLTFVLQLPYYKCANRLYFMFWIHTVKINCQQTECSILYLHSHNITRKFPPATRCCATRLCKKYPISVGFLCFSNLFTL